ncbi:aminoacetone oxidase family FAD-binding enzyme [bacterium 210820-DFI.6.37]|nr:aminoacetone oxidase family FAD-binding enzyme [bacterium 210820-DFI.6.37]
MLDICIIGGGASGLAAAISAAETQPKARIIILEKKAEAGKKLAATGNGKCNLTNLQCPKSGEILEFFRSLGVFTRIDGEGRVYPYSAQAKDVVRALVLRAEKSGVQIQKECPAEGVKLTSDGFQIVYKGGSLTARKLLLAAGGKAGPQFGTSGDGYTFAKALGHTVTRLAPVLTGMEVKADFQGLKGIRTDAAAALMKDERKIGAETGQVQFNEDGLSGICIMNLSRLVKLEAGESFAEGIGRYKICLDFLPELNDKQVMSLLKERCGLRQFEAKDLLLSILPSGLGTALLKAAGIRPEEKGTDVSENKLCKLSGLLKGWQLPLKGIKGWKAAQCTAGGVALEEINLAHMESRLVPGLYFSGEIIDFDGPCGGFNLQNAWETGIKAGRAMADAL